MVSSVNRNSTSLKQSRMESTFLQIKPKLFYVDSTLYSIFLRWETEEGNNGNLIYHIQMKDDIYIWITKYWGMKNHCEVKGLCPETLYYFRLGVSSELGGKEVVSDILITATKVGQPILFYLFKSAERGDVPGLLDFLNERKHSAALDAYDKNGETALIKGVKKGNEKIVMILLSAGSSVNQGALGSNRTPLMYACYLGYLDIAKALIQNGADINSIDNNKCGPLHYAVDYSQLELFKICVEHGSDINIKDTAGWTPLMRAVIFNSSKDMIEELIFRKADVYAKDKNGQTALSLAKIIQIQWLVEILSKLEEQIQIETDAHEDNNESIILKE